MTSPTIPTTETKSAAEILADLDRDTQAYIEKSNAEERERKAVIEAQKPKIEEAEKPKAKETKKQKPKQAPAPAPDPAPQSDQTPDWAAKLSPDHRKMIEDSAITPEVATARGYFTATKKAELKKLGFSDSQSLTPALAIPIHGVNGNVVTYQIRPDSPRVVDGEALKYETPRKSKMRLDVPPGARKNIGNLKIPLFITEGPRKADSAVSQGLCCLALLGVWNFRGENDDGGMTALPDWESIALKGKGGVPRKVYICFDSDIAEKLSVHLAMKRLKAFLESKGATVRIIYLKAGDGGAKVGLDDYLAQGHGFDDLLALSQDKLRLLIEPQKIVEKTISAILPDGRIIEQVANGVFAIFDTKKNQITYTKKVETDDAVHHPLDDDFILRGGLFLPDRLIDYGDEKTLDAEIETCINRYSDVPERERRLAARYVRLTYIREKLNEIPYIHAVGRRGSGKSRFICVIGMLCMRPILVTSPSAASLYRMMDAYHPTLIIDECNLATDSEDTRALIQILNSGFQRLTYISRCEKGGDGQLTVRLFSPFGPKLIGGLKLSESEAFESRCIQMRLEVTGRKDIPFRMTDAMLADFAELRAKLYMWRLRNLGRGWEKAFNDAEQELKGRKIEPRFIQIATPAYALIADPGLKKDFASMMEVRTDDATKEKKESLDGKLVNLIHEQLFDVVETEENGETVIKSVTLKTGASIPEPKDGKPCENLRVELLVEKINRDALEKHKVDSRYLAKQIRGLGFKTREISSRASTHWKKSAIVFDRIVVEKVSTHFSLPIPADFQSGQSGQSDNCLTFQEDSLTGLNSESAQSEIQSGQVNTQENQQVTEVTGLTGLNFPDKAENGNEWVAFGPDDDPPIKADYPVPQEVWPADWRAPWDEDRAIAAISE